MEFSTISMTWDTNSANTRKFLSFGLALLIVTANAIVGLHHHHNSDEHHGCAVCVVVHHSQAKSSSPSIGPHYLPAVIYISDLQALPIAYTFDSTPIQLRAPPRRAL